MQEVIQGSMVFFLNPLDPKNPMPGVFVHRKKDCDSLKEQIDSLMAGGRKLDLHHIYCKAVGDSVNPEHPFIEGACRANDEEPITPLVQLCSYYGIHAMTRADGEKVTALAFSVHPIPEKETDQVN